MRRRSLKLSCGRKGWGGGVMRLKPTWELCREFWFWARSLLQMVRAVHGGGLFLPGMGEVIKGGVSPQRGGFCPPKRRDEGFFPSRVQHPPGDFPVLVFFVIHHFRTPSRRFPTFTLPCPALLEPTLPPQLPWLSPRCPLRGSTALWEMSLRRRRRPLISFDLGAAGSHLARTLKGTFFCGATTSRPGKWHASEHRGPGGSRFLFVACPHNLRIFSRPCFCRWWRSRGGGVTANFHHPWGVIQHFTWGKLPWSRHDHRDRSGRHLRCWQGHSVDRASIKDTHVAFHSHTVPTMPPFPCYLHCACSSRLLAFWRLVCPCWAP